MNTKIFSLELKIKAFSILRTIDSLFSPVLRTVAAIAALVLASSLAYAQADFEKGYQAFQSYHGSDFDTVNLANGNLVLDIQLLSYEQLGGLPPIVVSIRSNSTTFQSTPPFSSGPTDTQQHEVTSGVIGAPWGQPHVSISPGGLYWKEERIVTAPKTAIGPEYLTRFVAYDDSGATHSLGGSIANQTAGYVPNIKYSVDGSGLMLQPGTTVTGPVLVDRKGNIGGLIDPNGNAIQLQGPCATAAGSGDYFNASLPGWEGYAHGTASATTIVDSIGRQIPNPSYLKPVATYSCLVDVDASYHPANPDANGCETYNFPANNNGASLPIANGATVPLKFCYAQIPVSASIANPSGSSLEYETINELWWVLTSVTLPNQTTWQFTYDNYGQVSSVTTPTGATVSYSYQSRLACGNPPGTIPVTGTPVWPFTNLMSSREVNKRILAVAGNSPAHWKYAYQIGSGWAGGPPGSTATNQVEYPGGADEGAVIVTDPELNDTVHLFALQNITGISSEETSSTCGPYETATQYYQGSSEVIPPNQPLPQCTWGNKCLKEVDTTYSNTGTDYANPTNFSNYIPVGVFPNLVTTTLTTNSSSLYSQDQYTYDSFGSYEDYTGETHPFSFGLALSSSESDFQNAAPAQPSQLPVTTTVIPALRSTLHTKQWQSNYAYYEANLIDLPCLDTVFSSTPTGTQKTCTPPTPPSNQVAQTSHTYDAHGNMLSTTRWLSGGTSPVTSTTYYSDGMPETKTDADGNTTTFNYDSSGLFLNKITYADTSFEVPQYDDMTGLLLSNTDVNNNKTNYSYDPMRRLLTVGYPDGGAEGLTYVDTVGSLSVTFTKTINGGSSTVPALSSLGVSYSAATLTKVALADGLGRLTETELTDPNEVSLGGRPIQVDTTYDLLGRVATVTNPYKRNTESTYGTTIYTYDALGRKAQIANPDGSTKQSCFNGIPTVGQVCQSNVPGAPAAWEDDTDENGNTWQRLQNGLGQMSYVYEPNGSSQASTMETNYTYDVLGNLLHVYQYGQAGVDTQLDTRNFHYDTLSRLILAYNPESGDDSYTYDANDNVLSKTSPAINGGTGTQTLYYAYDCMNRLVSKWLGTAPALPGCTVISPTVTAALLDTYNYGYTGVGCNAVGRLINEHAYNNSTLVDKRTNVCYDTMGRLTFENQIPYSPTGTIYPFTYTYDWSGNPITANNGLVASNEQTPCTSTGSSDLCFNFAYDAADRLQVAATTSQPSAWTPAANYPPLLLQANTVTTTAFGSGVIDEPYDSMGHLVNAQLSLATATAAAQLKIGRVYDDRGRITSEADGAYGKRTLATTSTGQIDIAGAYVSGDTGSVVITLSGGAIPTSVSTTAVNFNGNATAGALAASVESAINTTAATSAYVTASLTAGGATILLNSTSSYTGTTANFNVAATITDTSTPSYSAVTTNMSGGLNAVSTAYGPIYSYLVPADGYAPNGNLLAIDDSVIGPWAYTYDTLNRLTGSSSGAPSGAYYAGENGCWQYDGFGNRKQEAFATISSNACTASTHTIHQAASYNPANHITASSIAVYDLAGNVTYDTENDYLYDPEGRLCAVYSLVTSTWTQYIYDAEGLRVGKGTLSPSTTPTSCPAPIAANNYAPTNEYLLDLGGQQVTELTVSGSTVTPLHSNLYAGSHLLATYDLTGTASLHFPFDDPLGSKRLQASPTGAAELNCFSLPFGNNIPYGRTTYCPNVGTNTMPDSTEQHFTGKERDTESGNDYFGARYYSSFMGRFESPDKPFADQHSGDPQSWNLYMYAGDEPLVFVDPTGKGKVGDIALGIASGTLLFVWHSNPIVENGVNSIRDLAKAVMAPNPIAELKRQSEQEDAKREAVIDSVQKLGSAKGRQALVNSLKDAWNGQSLYQKSQTVTQLSLGVATAVAGGWAGAAGGGAAAAETVPATVVRAIPASINATSLGLPGAADVFVTSGGALDGMTSSQISNALTIPDSPSGFNLFEFATPEGIASPIGRTNPGFVGGGQTAGGLPEFVVPNGPIPAGATQTYVPPSQ